MHIWYFNHYAGGPGVGKFARAYHLSRVWAGMGHQTTVFVARFHHLLDNLEPLPPEHIVDGVRYVALPARVYHGNGMARLLNIADFCRSMLAVRAAPRLDPPDAIIVSSPHPFAIFPAARLAARYEAKLVFEVRDLWPLSLTDVMGVPSLHPLVPLSAIAERFAYRRADLVASLLGAAEEHMRGKGLAAGKFVHVPNGVVPEDASAEEPPRSAVGMAAAHQIETWKREGRVIAIHPGAQGVPNALDRLIDALGILKSSTEGDRLGVLLVGNGGSTAQLKSQAAGLRLDNVAFFDAVPKLEALWLTRRCDIGYAGARDHRSVYRYGISFNKIMDFMQAGLPVLLPLLARGDPVTASGCGIVTGNDDPHAIARALAGLVSLTPAERAAMGAKGCRYVEEMHDYRRIAENYIDAIRAAGTRKKA